MDCRNWGISCGFGHRKDTYTYLALWDFRHQCGSYQSRGSFDKCISKGCTRIPGSTLCPQSHKMKALGWLDEQVLTYFSQSHVKSTVAVERLDFTDGGYIATHRLLTNPLRERFLLYFMWCFFFLLNTSQNREVHSYKIVNKIFMYGTFHIMNGTDTSLDKLKEDISEVNWWKSRSITAQCDRTYKFLKYYIFQSILQRLIKYG